MGVPLSAGAPRGSQPSPTPAKSHHVLAGTRDPRRGQAALSIQHPNCSVKELIRTLERFSAQYSSEPMLNASPRGKSQRPNATAREGEEGQDGKKKFKKNPK